MVMCSKCRKRIAVVFVAKVENGNKVTEGLCMKCAKELGIPVETMLGNVMDKMGIPPEMIENMESMEGDINDYLTQIDVLMLAPHYAVELDKFTKLAAPHNVKVAVIPKDVYGMLDGAKLIEIATGLVTE